MPEQDVSSSLGGCAGCLDGARGWNADQFGRRHGRPPVQLFPSRRGWQGTGPGHCLVVVGTLLGPEGTDLPPVGECLWVLPGGGWGFLRARAFLHLVPLDLYRQLRLSVGRGLAGWVWGVVGRSLRTAQWTRASSTVRGSPFVSGRVGRGCLLSGSRRRVAGSGCGGSWFVGFVWPSC